mgnify:CR=1 FL=1
MMTLEETIDLMYENFIDPNWVVYDLNHIDLGQDEQYAVEYFNNKVLMGSILILRFDRMVISLRINSNDVVLPGLYEEFLEPYVREMEYRFLKNN